MQENVDLTGHVTAKGKQTGRVICKGSSKEEENPVRRPMVETGRVKDVIRKGTVWTTRQIMGGDLAESGLISQGGKY